MKKSIAESYNDKPSKLIGKIHLFCGAVSFFTGVCLIINTNMGDVPGFEIVGAGIWSSACLFLSGYLGIITARNKFACWIIITMIAGIFSAIISGILIILSAIALAVGMCILAVGSPIVTLESLLG